MPEPKKNDSSFKSLKPVQQPVAYQHPVPRPSSRHKRHAEPVSLTRQSVDRKARKRKTLEKLGAGVVSILLLVFLWIDLLIPELNIKLFIIFYTFSLYFNLFFTNISTIFIFMYFILIH